MVKKLKKIFFIEILVIFLFLSLGCSNFPILSNFNTDKKNSKNSCADIAIERAFKLHERAKYSLALFYDERSDDQLYKAFYAAFDSVRESVKVKKCWDRRRTHYYAMENLKEMNTSLARVIRRNLPDDDSGEMIAIYHNQFDWVMPHMR
tara:strand:+ start:238 stop:684 length:447 start_codon:yes stop_codon:yes gene_type:complete